MRRAEVWRVIGAVLLLAGLWHLRAPLLLFFGAVLAAAALHALAGPLVRTGRLSRRRALLLVVVGLVGAVTLGLWLLGEPLAEQLQALQTALPKAWQALRDGLQRSAVGRRVLEAVANTHDLPVPWTGIAGMAAGTARMLAAIVLVALMGLYLALDVALYRDGLVALVPPPHRARARTLLDATGEALSRWLLGQAVAMAVVGVTVSVGLALLGMPLALALGVIAGVLEFVPYVGPIASGLLAVLVAFPQGPTQALSVAALFVAIQQVENHVLVPLVQRWAVSLPPALTLAGVVVFGALFGPLGIAFGTPLTVVAMLWVKRLYVEPMEGGAAAGADPAAGPEPGPEPKATDAASS